MPEDPQEDQEQEALSEAQLETVRRVLRIQIDGDWDDAMINTAFANLERLLLRVENEDPPGEPVVGAAAKPARRSGSARRRGGRRG